MFIKYTLFYNELMNFLIFLKKPVFNESFFKDDLSNKTISYLYRNCKTIVSWVIFLWFINIFILGPLSYTAANIIGAHHKMESQSIPIFKAIFWAPLIEEIIFRYCLLCNPIHYLILLPLFIFILLFKVSNFYSLIIPLIIICSLILFHSRNYFYSETIMICYKKYYSFLFYFSNLLFAYIHLFNFSFDKQSNLFLVPFLVFPQFITGFVLGWVRISLGIFYSIILHALFNAGPVLLTWFFSEKIFN